MRRPIIVALLLCAVAWAQQPDSPPQVRQPAGAQQPASREDVIRLFKALRLEKTLELMQATLAANLEQLLQQSVEKYAGSLTPEQQARIQAYRERNRERARKAYPISEILEDFVPIYQKHFTQEDVQAVVAFYESPAGQRLLDSQPELMREGMAVIAPKLQQRMQVLEKEMRRDAEETFAPDRDKAPAPAKPQG